MEGAASDGATKRFCGASEEGRDGLGPLSRVRGEPPDGAQVDQALRGARLRGAGGAQQAPRERSVGNGGRRRARHADGAEEAPHVGPSQARGRPRENARRGSTEREDGRPNSQASGARAHARETAAGERRRTRPGGEDDSAERDVDHRLQGLVADTRRQAREPSDRAGRLQHVSCSPSPCACRRRRP